MHESSFSYNVSRPYPYPWFTWVVIIGGVLATALFSVINLAADGYELINVPTSDPNATSQTHNRDGFRSGRCLTRLNLNSEQLAATCQPQIITGGSQFYTNNTLLAWTGNMVELNIGVVEPSFAYLNNVLEDCNIMEVSIELSTATAALQSIWSINHCASAYCNVSTTSGMKSIQLSAGYQDSDISRAPGLQNIVYSPNQIIFIWGSYFFENFAGTVAQGKYNSTANIQAAVNTSCPSGSTPTISILVSFNQSDTNPISPYFFYYSTTTLGRDCMFFTGVDGVSIYVDSLIKSWYSLALSDLGQAGATNILANPRLIMKLTETSPVPLDIYNPPSDLYQNETVFFDYFTKYFVKWWSIDEQVAASMPVVLPSVIAQQYLCQVPQLKSTGSLLVAVLVADLVFLQVLWKVLNLIVAFSLKRRRRDANYCDGCAKRIPLPPAKEGDYELVGGGVVTDAAADNDDGAGSSIKTGIALGKMSGDGVREAELHRHRSKSTLGEHD